MRSTCSQGREASANTIQYNTIKICRALAWIKYIESEALDRATECYHRDYFTFYVTTTPTKMMMMMKLHILPRAEKLES